MKPRHAALAAIAVILVVGGLRTMRAAGRPGPGAAPGKPAATREEYAVPVEVAVARQGEMLHALEVTGTLKSDHDVHITSKVPGKVAAVAVKEGDRVRAGQLLVTLEETDLRAQADQARAYLRSAEERLTQSKAAESLRYAQTDAQIEQADANLRAARVRLQQLEANIRMTDASARGAVARAESGLKAAQEGLQVVKEGARSQERRVVENAVEQADVNLDSARSRVTRRRELFRQGAISREDLDEWEKQLKLAEAQHNSAVQQRDLVREGARSEEVRIAEEQVRQAEEGLREARAGLERTQVSKDELAAAREQVAQLVAAYKVAQANKSQYQIVPSEIAAAEAGVDQARAQVALAEEQLANVRIVSPVDGVIASRTVNAGESIGTGNPLVNVVAVNSVYFEAQVPELSIGAVRSGMRVRITIDSLPGRTLAGMVREVIPVANADSKSFRVRIAVSGAVSLPVGAFARGRVEIGRTEDALLLPKDCLMSLAGETYVFVVTDGSVRRQTVKQGESDAANVVILSGVKPDDRVVTGGATSLNDGDRVKVVVGR
ncbi:MAG: efflux RND transporter periplasmic adaptor subunit [Armatimonadetes bacterium]|nr:efflux RND transporter periplasmic adaptor subunit [Armatimonadota bacterium]